MIVSLLVIGGFVGFVNFESEKAQGLTYVGGIVYDGAGGPWTLIGSPYIVVDNLTIPPGETLTIQPGVEVRFDGSYNVTVYGTLTAIGTETDRIIITSNKIGPAPEDWRCIRVTSIGHVEIKYCNLSYSTFGLYLYESSNNIISNNILSYNGVSIRAQYSSNNNIITHNNISYNYAEGISVAHSSNNNIITYNNILNNEEAIIVGYSSNNIITYNNITNNNRGIFLGDSINITITNNNFVNDGIFIRGNGLPHFNSHTIPDNNIVNGKPLYYYKDSSGFNIDGIPVGELILANCTDFNVKNLYINNTYVGIEVAYSTNISIAHNYLSSNKEYYGIHLCTSSNNIIINNNISNCSWGIELRQSSNNNIVANNNVSSSNHYGISVGVSSNNNIIVNNNILSSNWSGIRIGLCTNDNSFNNTVIGNNISNNNYGILIDGFWMVIPGNNTIKGNYISNNICGIHIYFDTDNKITGNEFSNNNCSIYLYTSFYNTITNNSFSNGEYGIFFFEWSNNNVIVGNTISNHNYGVYIDFLSSANRFYHNYFIDNVNQAYDNRSDNYWDDGYPSGGNYWSDFDEPDEGAYDDYQGVDQNILGSDGIIDNGTIAGGGKNPYVIDADSQDNYPLRAPPPLPPVLYINTSQDRKDVILYWDMPSIIGIDHYLIYRSTSQTDFYFNTVWVNTSGDNETGEPAPIPLRTIWNDTNAAFPGNKTNYEDQYYYVIRAVNVIGEVSGTSRTVGKWTKTFPQGVSTFSLPLEPLETRTTDYYLTNMNATYIKWMNQTTHTWMKHGEGGVNDTQMKLGEGYEVNFDSQTNYTFTGMPGAMINYDDDTGFLGFDHATEAKNLTVSVEPNGNVILTWEEPTSMNSGDWYEVYYSNTRDGFFGTFNVSYFIVCPTVYFGNNTTTHNGALANNPGTQLYYMVVPFNASGVKGASTYSIGIWAEEYLSQYDTFGIPLKLSSYQTADWFCDNIPDTVGMNYYIVNEQRWGWHSERMPKGAFDPMLEMTIGYQISTSSVTKFIFIGV